MSNNHPNNGRSATDPAGRSADQIQHEIDRTRSDMEQTLTAIQRKLSPEFITDEVVSYLRNGGATEFLHNFNESVKRNPMPVTLMGIGLAWLMMSGRQGSYAPHNASESHMGDRLRGAAGALGGMARAGRERVSDAALGVRERAAHVGSSVRSQAAHLRERGAEMGGRARGGAGQLGGSAREGAYRARSNMAGMGEMMREQPLLLGALGVALGAALGSMLPPTRQEDEWMGDTRDRFARQARDQMNEGLERGRRVAEAAGDAAQEEARRQSSDAGRQGQPPKPPAGQPAPRL